jgi:hypothetical protein
VRRAPVAVLVAVLPLGVLALPRGEARAAGEDEWQLSARLGGANKNGYPFAPWGLAGALDLEYGVDDAWAARVSVGTLAHPVPAVKDVTPGGTLRASSALLGATYTFDVLRLVPYIAGGVGVMWWSGGGAAAHAQLAAEVGVGADYLLTPHWAWGASAQYVFAPGELVSNAMELGQSPLAFSATLRFSWIF